MRWLNHSDTRPSGSVSHALRNSHLSCRVWWNQLPYLTKSGVRLGGPRDQTSFGDAVLPTRPVSAWTRSVQLTDLNNTVEWSPKSIPEILLVTAAGVCVSHTAAGHCHGWIHSVRTKVLTEKYCTRRMQTTARAGKRAVGQLDSEEGCRAPERRTPRCAKFAARRQQRAPARTQKNELWALFPPAMFLWPPLTPLSAAIEPLSISRWR